MGPKLQPTFHVTIPGGLEDLRHRSKKSMESLPRYYTDEFVWFQDTTVTGEST